MGKSKSEYTLADLFKLILDPTPANNLCYNEAGWNLSYLPYASDTDDSETAIVLGSGGMQSTYLILYGDHRDQLRGKTRDEAVAYWQSHPELHGATTDTMED